MLYLEGDGVVIKGTKKRLEFHRYQVCEDIINLSKTRRKRVQAKEFVSLSRLNALQEIKAYLANAFSWAITLFSDLIIFMISAIIDSIKDQLLMCFLFLTSDYWSFCFSSSPNSTDLSFF